MEQSQPHTLMMGLENRISTLEISESWTALPHIPATPRYTWEECKPVVHADILHMSIHTNFTYNIPSVNNLPVHQRWEAAFSGMTSPVRQRWDAACGVCMRWNNYTLGAKRDPRCNSDRPWKCSTDGESQAQNVTWFCLYKMSGTGESTRQKVSQQELGTESVGPIGIMTMSPD